MVSCYGILCAIVALSRVQLTFKPAFYEVSLLSAIIFAQKDFLFNQIYFFSSLHHKTQHFHIRHLLQPTYLYLFSFFSIKTKAYITTLASIAQTHVKMLFSDSQGTEDQKRTDRVFL